MPNPSTPAGAARAAVNAAATLTRELEQRVLGAAAEAVNVDGRKRRWQQHKQARRDELITGTVEAVRRVGPDAGMDEIAAQIGVSKTVLYRYFNDKNDLASAVTEHFLETNVLPRLTATLTDDLDDYQLVRAALGVYVHSVADDPHLYRFCVRADLQSGAAIVAALGVVTDALEATLASRLGQRGADVTGSRTWSLAITGAVERAVDGWITSPLIPVDRLVDELTMMIWGGVTGIVLADGSPETFTADPPTIPPLV